MTDYHKITDIKYLSKRFNELLSARKDKALSLLESTLDGEYPTYEKQILERFESLTNTNLDASSALLFQVLQGLMYQMVDPLLQVVAESNRYLLENIGQAK